MSAVDRAYNRHALDSLRKRYSKPVPRTPNFRNAREWLEAECFKQFQIDARAGMSRPIPLQLQRKWWGPYSRRAKVPLSTLSVGQLAELARAVADYTAQYGTRKHYLDQVPRAKMRRGEAA